MPFFLSSFFPTLQSFVLLFFVSTSFPIPTLGAKLLSGTIEKISDGDTIQFKPEKGDSFLRVRLIGIDAPETEQAPWGKAATKALSQLASVGTKATLKIYGTDKYRRSLAVLLFQEIDLNQKMLEQGQVTLYLLCAEKNCHKTEFLDLQNIKQYAQVCREAEQAKKGIWNPQNPLLEHPFEFRLAKRGQENTQWVGHIETKELVSPREYRKIPPCSRIFFVKKSYAIEAGYFPK